MLLTRQCRSLSMPGCPTGRRVTRSVLIIPPARVPSFSGALAQTNGILSSLSISRRPGSCMPCRSAADTNVSTAAAATPTVLYVSELDASVKGDDLTSHFKAQPGFESAFVMNVDGEDGQQHHMGYVQFSSAEAAAAAQKALDGSELRQKRISVRSQKQSSSSGSSSSSSKEEEAQEEPSSDAEPSGPATPQHTAATPATSEATSSSSSEQEGGSQEADGAGEEDSPSSGTSRSAKHRQRQKSKRLPLPAASPKVLFVPNMKQGTTEEELVEHFRKQPGYETAQLRLFSNRRADGYVTFASAEAAAAAMEALQGSKLNSKPVKIYIHDPLSKERQAELAASNSTKSKKQQPAAAQAADSSTAAAGGDGSADSSSSSKAGRKQRQQQRSRMTYSVKVSNMSWSTTAESLSQHFADCPGFIKAKIILDEQDRASGIGYVLFNTPEAAQAAIQAKHETQLDERTIRVFISAREAGKFAAAADAGGSNRSRKGGRGAWALQVFNLAWETTEDDLVEHFKDCPGYTGAFIVTSQDNRPSGQGYISFDSKDSQNTAFKAKQNSELVGRSIFLRLTRAGRVESVEGSGSAEAGAPDAGADTDSVAKEAAVLDKTDLVLMGLPPTFGYREVLGLCSYFGEVKGVVRLRKGPNKAATNTEDKGSSGGSADKEDSSKGSGGDAVAAAKDAVESAPVGQPCFVMMATAKAAAAAVSALNQRYVQGVRLTAAFANPKPVPKKKNSKKKQKETAAAEAAAEAPADEQSPGDGGTAAVAAK